MDPRIDRLRELLTADPRVAAALVFGSVARGRTHAESDLDLAILWTDEAARKHFVGDPLVFLGRCTKAAGKEVHLVDVEQASPPLRQRIFRDAMVLVDRDPARLRRLHYEALRDVIDWEWLRRMQDRRLREQLRDHG
jgi:predicted nucleotidyltransferase